MASNIEDFRGPDLQFIFEALNHTTAPITINVTSLGAAKDAIPKTMASRIQQIAKRYNLSLATTTKGEVVKGAAPATPAKKRSTPGGKKTPGSTGEKKRKVVTKRAKEETTDEDEDEQWLAMQLKREMEEGCEDEKIPVKKQKKTSDGKVEQDASVDGENGDELA